MFSIIIPAHNAAERLPVLLNSIKAQTFKDYEIIVICDACTDMTDAIANASGAEVYYTDAHNCADARNKGLDHATHKYVLFCDDDDYWIHPFALEQMAVELKRNQNADIIQCAFVYGKRGVTATNGKIWPNVWSKIWKRSAIGLTRFPHDMFPADDLGFTQAMIDKGVTVWFSPLLWYYYVYPRKGSITWNLENA